jgi:hypothetical protein
MLLCGMLAGCRHVSPLATAPPQIQAPDKSLQPPPDAKLPPMESAPPDAVTDAKPVVPAQAKPKKRVKKPAPQPATPAPAAGPAPGSPTVSTDTQPPPAEPSALGALAPRGEADPKDQQEVAGKISAIEKRLNELPSSVAEQELKQIAKIRLFTSRAADALKSGDVEGAKVLATKAELLLDDLQK